MDRLYEAKQVFNKEIIALKKTRDSLDDVYLKILDIIIECKGRVIITGVGKPGHIAAKIASTFSSLGTPSFCVHPAEALHGDLGMVTSEDVVIVISFSGESDEIIRILPSIKMIGAKLIGITGNHNSTLASAADVVQVLPAFAEACHLGIAPTSSTTVELCYGDSLAVVVSKIHGFNESDFGKYHPGGSLGKKLVLKVEDLMSTGEKNACVDSKASLKDAIIELSKKGLGAVSVLDQNDRLIGIITDGDLRRQLEKGANIYSLMAGDVMSIHPVTIEKNCLAVDALRVLKEKNISCLIVTDGNNPIGMIRIQDIIGVGIVG